MSRQPIGGELRPVWRTAGSGFCAIDGVPPDARIVIVDVESDSHAIRPLVDVARLREQLQRCTGAEPAGTGVPFADFQLADADEAIEFRYDDRWFRCIIATSDVTPLAPDQQDLRRRSAPRHLRDTFLAPRLAVCERPSPDGRWLLAEHEKNLALRSATGNELVVLTRDGATDITWSVEKSVWAPGAERVTALRSDTRGLDRLPLVDWLSPTTPVQLVPYTRSGRPKESTALAIVDVGTHDVVEVELGFAADDIHLLHVVGWAPDGDLLFLVTDRRNKCLQLRRADPVTGASKLLVEERQDTFVYGIRMEAFLTNATLLPDGRHLIWLSERDGWRHAYLYTLDGALVRQLTSGNLEVERVVGLSGDRGTAYLLARSDPDRPYDQHLCATPLDRGGLRQLTSHPGIHQPLISPDGTYAVDIHSNVSRPPTTDIVWLDRSGHATVSVARAKPADTGVTVEEFQVTALDGRTVVWGHLYKPPNFDHALRYPIVESIYAGPQTIRHAKDFRTDNIARSLAHLGFVTFEVDAPGTPGRGKQFQDVVYGRFGQFEISEHHNVLRQLLSRHAFLDAEQVGIVGASWGGYHAIRALLLEPQAFHVGVALYPVVDCFEHLGPAIEPYLGLPSDAPESYERASSLPLLDRLEGQLLVIHGTADVNAPIAATMKLVDGLVETGRRCDLLVVPGMEHTVQGAVGDYVLESIAEYFARHLG